MDLIEDQGLAIVASSCNKLQELRVFPSDPLDPAGEVSLTERGLVDVIASCPMLESVLYFCRRMTNETLITIAKNRPNFTCFRLCCYASLRLILQTTSHTSPLMQVSVLLQNRARALRAFLSQVFSQIMYSNLSGHMLIVLRCSQLPLLETVTQACITSFRAARA
jgi:hypothetical protein